MWINFVYKNSIIATECIDFPYTRENLAMIAPWLSQGKIIKPENYERYIVTETEMTEKEKLWVV